MMWTIKFSQICCTEAFANPANSSKKILVNTDASVGTLTDVTHEDKAGSFAFPPDQQQIPALRNRFVLWRTSGSFLSLEEHSLDWNLEESAVTLEFQNTSILNGVSISAHSRESVHILVATVSSVHRFIVRHPWKLHRNLAIGSKDDSLPSVLRDITDESVAGTSDWLGIDDSGLEGTPRAAATVLNWKCEAVFALAYSDSSILIVSLPTARSNDNPVKEIIRPSSTVKRLWNGLVTPFLRSSDDANPETSVGLRFHAEEEDTLLFAVNRGHQLRVWSCTSKKLKSSTDMPSCLARYQNLKDPVTIAPNDKAMIRKCLAGNTLFIAVSLFLNGTTEFLILCPTPLRTQTSLAKVVNFDSPELQLVDFDLTPCYLWTVWLDSANRAIVKYKSVSLTDIEHGPWNEVSVGAQHRFSPIIDRLAEAGSDMREIGLKEVLKPGRFSCDSVTRALRVVSGRNLEIPVGCTDWNELSRLISLSAAAFSDSSKRSLDLSHNESFISSANRNEFMFWKALWSSCIQFHQAAEKPLGLLSVPEIDLYGIITKERFSVFMPVESCGQYIHQFGMRKEQFVMSECLEKVRQIWSELEWKELSRLLVGKNESQIWSYLCDRTRIIAVEKRREAEVSELYVRLRNVEHWLTDFCDEVMTNLSHCSLDAIELQENVSPEYERFLSSSLASGLLASGFESAVNYRQGLCSELLVLLAFAVTWKQEMSLVQETWYELEKERIPNLAKLCQVYQTLRWIAELRATSATNDYADAVRLMSELCLTRPSDNLPMNTTAVAELFRCGRSASVLRCLFASQRQLEAWQCPSPLVWGAGAAQLVSVALGAVWPGSELLILPNFLVSAAQYQQLAEYCKHMSPWRGDLVYAKWFYCGVAELHMNQTELAYESFMKAFTGVQLPGSALKEQLFGKESFGKSVAGDYFLKVVNLFETRNHLTEAMKVAEKGLDVLDESDRNLPKLWTVLFKNQLSSGRFQKALMSALRNPDSDMQRNCLRQLLNSLMEQGKVKQLVELNYGPLDPEVVEILESRARVLDLATSKQNYYELLYSYFMRRNNFRKAASTMHELAGRLKSEEPTDASLRKQLTSLAASVSALSLVGEEYRWLVRTCRSELREGTEKSPKRDAEGKERHRSVGVEIVDLETLRKEYLLCEVKGQLMEAGKRRAASKNQGFLCRMTDSPSELLDLLMEKDLFDSALILSLAFGLSLRTVLKGVTERCVQCARVRRDTRKGKESYAVVPWLSHNRMIYSEPSFHIRPVDNCWKFLEAYMDHLSKSESSAVLLRAVSEHLLSLGWDLPRWLLDRYKTADVGDCLRTLITYDKLTDSVIVVSEYVEAILGAGIEEFGLKSTSLQPGGDSVWLPYSSIELLLELLGERREPEIATKLKDLEKKLGHYFKQLESVTKIQWSRTGRKQLSVR